MVHWLDQSDAGFEAEFQDFLSLKREASVDVDTAVAEAFIVAAYDVVGGNNVLCRLVAVDGRTSACCHTSRARHAATASHQGTPSPAAAPNPKATPS